MNNSHVPLAELLDRIRTRLRSSNIEAAFKSFDKNKNSSLDKYPSIYFLKNYIQKIL